LFIGGLALLLRLHTYRDHVAHLVILPLFLLLWIVLAVCVWDGRRNMAPRLRFILFAAQAFAALLASALFFRQLLHTTL
jgi:hypothetical protein